MKRIPIVILITALCIGAFLFFDTCSTNPQQLKPDKQQVEKAQEQLTVNDVHYQKAISIMKTHSDSLQKELNLAQRQLIAVKLKLQQAKFDVVKLVEKDTSGLSVEQKLNDCDSLKDEVLDYVFLVDSTQQDYDKSIVRLNNLLAIKDSQIVICNTSYNDLKSIADENLQRQRKLTEDMEISYKQQRKKQIQNKVLAAGFLILSGITTTLLIKSGQ